MNVYRLREFVNPSDGRSLVIDVSAGLVLGVRPGLERFASAITPVLPVVDGIVTSPGQARHLVNRTRQDAALLVRADWTNALRDEDFVLPPETIQHVSLLNSAGALDLGASGMVIHFLLGYTEAIEAECLKRTVALALDGNQNGLPLIVDVQPTGSRVVLPGKAVELGVSYALEGGASGIVVPWPGAESFRSIKTMTDDIPVWLHTSDPDPAHPDTLKALELGAAGLWLGDSLFAGPDPVAAASIFRALVHSSAPEVA